MALDSEATAVDKASTRKKSPRTTRNKKKETAKPEESKEMQSAPEEQKVSRRDLLDKALRAVEDQLNSEKKPSTATIGNLVRLIKLDRDLGKDEDVPQEITVLWEETEEEEDEEDPEDDQ